MRAFFDVFLGTPAIVFSNGRFSSLSMEDSFWDVFFGIAWWLNQPIRKIFNIVSFHQRCKIYKNIIL